MRSHSWNYRRYAAAAMSILIAVAAACSSGGDDSGTPTATPTPLAGQRSPTALVPIPPTPVLNATPTAGPTAVSTTTSPGPTATATRPTPTSSAPSGTATPTPTTAPAATQTPTPSPTATPPVIESGRELVREPAGVLQLRPGIGTAAQYSPGVNAANFRINVGFTNPFHPSFSPWDYGVKFRDDGLTYQMFVFDHEGNLSLINGSGNNLDVVKTVPVTNMSTTGGGQNRFTILVVGDRASVLIDQDLIEVFDVTESAQGTEVSLVSDIFNQTIVVGANTEFFDLVVNSAGLIGFAASGELARQQPDQIPLGEFSFPSSAAYTKITFVSPINAFSGDYSFGLLFRSVDGGIDNWLVIDDSKTWQHVKRSTTGAESVVRSGPADRMGTAAGSENFLEFFSTGQQNNVYLNGELMTSIVFAAGDLPFNIAPMAAFEPGHQAGGIATEFHDFAVWSVEG